MRYRVKFRFWRSLGAGFYYSEWFDTLDEAKAFVDHAFFAAALNVIQIEDEEGEVV